MPREVRTSKAKIETEVAPSLKKKFERWCKKHNISMAQSVRDMIQDAIKNR